MRGIKNNISIFFILSACLCFNGCGRKKLEPQAYVHSIKDYTTGVHKIKKVGKLIFDLQYKPLDYIILSENKGIIPDSKIYSQRENELKDLQFYTLKIRAEDNSDLLKQGISDEREYYHKLYYFSYEFQEHLSLEEGEKSFPCKLFHFERSYDLSNSKTFVLAFPKTSLSADQTLVIDSPEFKSGAIRIKFDHEALAALPELNKNFYEKN